ncbi:hypothetical protein TSUD_232830 [Trifolium subterraneum]|uniref:Uncharacterized protein n=1 Tax=Trifolium subterraneum TaxID=3900 RepID=A0A2Z6LN93_TRISU|nr:hypothetical protein TSUD_232830 [Trifolium subterraneum]
MAIVLYYSYHLLEAVTSYSYLWVTCGFTCFYCVQAAIVNSQTLEEVARLEKAAIVNSQTLEEVARLEKAPKSGQLPADIQSLTDNVNEKHEDAVLGESNDTRAEKYRFYSNGTGLE